MFQDFQYQFGPFLLERKRRVLLRSGERVPLTSKPLETLLVLVECAGETVSKNELLDQVWGETAVEENNLNKSISAIRRALGERRGDHQYVATVPGIGYRFVAPVTRIESEAHREAVAAEMEASTISLVSPNPPRFGHRAAWIGVALALLVLSSVV